MAVSERPDIILMDLEMPNVALSHCPHTRSPVNARGRSRRGATSSTPSRSNSIAWSQPFGAFSPTANDALTLENRNRVFVGARLVRIIPGGRLNTSVISKGWIAGHWRGIPAIQNN
jgi:hypothetical protein